MPLDVKAITVCSWAELDVTTLTDAAAIRTAARQLKQQGADYALVTLKDAAGTVYYAPGAAAAAAAAAPAMASRSTGTPWICAAGTAAASCVSPPPPTRTWTGSAARCP